MKGIFKEFRAFIARGNVIDLAIGVIIGSAFTGIVNSIVNDIFMPLLGLLTNGINFSNLVITIGPGEEDVIKYGAFISALINFLLIALVLFFVVKLINKLRRKKEEAPAPTTKKCPYCQSEISIDAVRCPHCTSDLPETE